MRPPFVFSVRDIHQRHNTALPSHHGVSVAYARTVIFICPAIANMDLRV